MVAAGHLEVGGEVIRVRQYSEGAPEMNSQMAQLVSHLANEDLSEDAICEFLVNHSLKFLGVRHAWISQVTNRETVRARASYGVDQSKFQDWQEFPLEWKLPVTDALVEKRIVWINSLPDWPEEYPRLNGVTYEGAARTQVVVPIFRLNSSVGCLGLVSSEFLLPDEEVAIFLQTIANLISLHIYRQARERKKQESPNVSSLTERQIQILDLIANKRTNIEIANIMGYSESTIRQETIRIFEKLHVNGRNEARKYFLENKERFGISDKNLSDFPPAREEFAH